ncbi:hypothetical protein ACIQRK_26695 [Streptomyces anulatus]
MLIALYHYVPVVRRDSRGNLRRAGKTGKTGKTGKAGKGGKTGGWSFAMPPAVLPSQLVEGDGRA